MFANVQITHKNVEDLNRGDMFLDASERLGKVMLVKVYEETRIVKVEYKTPGKTAQIGHDEYFAHIGDTVNVCW